MLPFDELFAGYDPSARVIDDFFQNKLAFTVLLNFPLATLDECLKDGGAWSRRQWAEVRLAQRFDKRIPAHVNLAIAQAGADGGAVHLGIQHLDVPPPRPAGPAPFPAQDAAAQPLEFARRNQGRLHRKEQGLARQRMIQQVMERIVTQTIPEVSINNPGVDWNPCSNEVEAGSGKRCRPGGGEKRIEDRQRARARHALRRAAEGFQTSRKADPYSPTAPTLIDRRFNEDREIPEARLKAMLERILTSPLVPRTAQLIASRLGRPLEPFDFWYDGISSAAANTPKRSWTK